MFILISYFIIGLLTFARYDDMNPYVKVTYGFIFPLHWLLGTWVTASINDRAESIWDNEPFLIGVFIICLLLLASG